HCSPCSSCNACCSGLSCPPCATASIVVTSCPCICTVKIRQERAGLPSTHTVQAPQTPCSQPICVPVRCKSSRSASDSNLRGWARNSCVSPLTLSRIGTLLIASPPPVRPPP